MKFRKKPVVIEAFKVVEVLQAAAHNWTNLPIQIRKAYGNGDIVFTHEAIFISTLEGKMEAQLGDWIIQGVKGELYPCKPDIFEATYEQVKDSPNA